MSEVVLNAVVRNETGGAMNRLRYADKIPGVYYAHGETNINITATPLAMKPLIYTTNTHLINLKLNNGESKTCILRDVQFDPITDRPIHFDLQGVKENEELTVLIPVVLNGSPKGVKDGGTVQHIMHKVRVSCLPKYIPEQIMLEIADLGMNDSIHVRDIKIDNVRILDNPASAVVGVVPPTVVKEEVAAVVPGATPDATASAAVEPEVIAKGKKPAEPEVITKGKKPVEGEAAAAPAKK